MQSVKGFLRTGAQTIFQENEEIPWDDTWTQLAPAEDCAVTVDLNVSDLDRLVRASSPMPTRTEVPQGPRIVPPPKRRRTEEGYNVQNAQPAMSSTEPAMPSTGSGITVQGPLPQSSTEFRHGWMNKIIPLLAAEQIGDQAQVHAWAQWLRSLGQVQMLVNRHIAMLNDNQASPWDFLRLGKPTKRERHQ